MNLKRVAKCTAVAAIQCVWAVTASVSADEVRVNNIWVPQVEVIEVANGQIHYLTAAGGDMRRPLATVTGIRLDRYPDYNRAFTRLSEGDDTAAIEVLLKVQRQVREKDAWVGYEVGRQLVAAYDRQQQGAQAASAYIQLIDRGADYTFLDAPPVSSVRALSEERKAALRPQIARAAKRAPELAQESAERLVAAAASGGSAPSRTKASQPARLAEGRYPADGGAALLPATVNRSPLGDLVFAGEFQSAVTQANKILGDRASSEVLMLRSLARLGVARKTNAAEDYQDAGLDFMRVVVYFPSGPHVAPALLELAVIHDQLGDTDQADRLFAEAGRLLNPEDHPRYHRRYTQLTAVRK